MKVSLEEQEFILSLLNQGYRVLKLEGGDLYSVSEFTPADGKINSYHSLRGRRITEILEKKTILRDIKAVVTHIEEQLREQNLWIHESIKFIFMTEA